MKNVLVIVDAQNDFVNKKGALYVPEAEEAVKNINKLVDKKLSNFDKVIVTMDTHYKKAYEENEESKLFPIHCIPKTWGHNLAIRGLLEYDTFVKNKFNIWKGCNIYEDYIKEFNKKTNFYFVGVATNYCVYYNIIGMFERGFKNIFIFEDCVKSIPDKTEDINVIEMIEKGVKFISYESF